MSKNIAGSIRSPLTFAEVHLHTPNSATPTLVGWLSRAGDNLRVSFHEDYLADPARPTLSQLYRGRTDAESLAIMKAMNDSRVVRIGALPVYFENLLPEGHNRDRLAARRGVELDDEFELLAAAGHDLIGGVEILPAYDVPHGVLELHATKGLEPLEASAVAAPVEDGFSVGGYVTKFSMVHRGHRYVIRRGTEAGEILAKLPSVNYPDMVENEAACYQLAAAAGVTTAGATARDISELNIPEESLPFKSYLHVPRFDRRQLADGSIKRVHFEELTQALGMESRRKYRDLEGSMVALLIGLQASDAPRRQDDIDEVFRRWTAYALMGNTDAHAKNWGLLYLDGRNASLAPAYDMVCVSAYFDPSNNLALAQNKKMDEQLRKWDESAAEALAKQAGILNLARVRKVVRETQRRAADLWPALLEQAPDGVAREIRSRLASLVPASRSEPTRLARRP